MVEPEKAVRVGLQIVLFFCFLAALINAILELASQRTTTSIEYEESPMVLPSLTFCPLKVKTENNLYPMFNLGSNKTMIQLLDDISSLKEDFLHVELFVSDNPFNVESSANSNPKEVYNLLNYPVKETIQLLPHMGLGRCVTFDPPKASFDFNSATANFVINMTRYWIIAVERHEVNQQVPVYINKWDQLDFFEEGSLLSIITETTKTVNIDTYAKSCDPKNTNKRTDCINQFVLHKLGCTPPWFKPLKGRICDKTADLDNLINIFAHLFTKEMLEEVKAFGCLSDNCESLIWSIAQQNKVPMNTFYPSNHTFFSPGLAQVAYEAQRFTPVKVVRQHLAYGFSNFVAEFGGYLGLLLGLSLLSIYDNSIETIKSLLAKKRANAETKISSGTDE